MQFTLNPTNSLANDIVIHCYDSSIRYFMLTLNYTLSINYAFDNNVISVDFMINNKITSSSTINALDEYNSDIVNRIKDHCDMLAIINS